MNSFTLECSFFGKDIKTKEEQSNTMNPYGVPPTKKKRLIHMTIEDYNSLGEYLMRTMHNYLPSEQYKL